MTSEFGGAAGQFGTAYDRRAADYASAIEPTLRPLHRRIVEVAQIGPGMDVLDLATGTGDFRRKPLRPSRPPPISAGGSLSITTGP